MGLLPKCSWGGQSSKYFGIMSQIIVLAFGSLWCLISCRILPLVVRGTTAVRGLSSWHWWRQASSLATLNLFVNGLSCKLSMCWCKAHGFSCLTSLRICSLYLLQLVQPLRYGAALCKLVCGMIIGTFVAWAVASLPCSSALLVGARALLRNSVGVMGIVVICCLGSFAAFTFLIFVG